MDGRTVAGAGTGAGCVDAVGGASRLGSAGGACGSRTVSAGFRLGTGRVVTEGPRSGLVRPEAIPVVGPVVARDGGVTSGVVPIEARAGASAGVGVTGALPETSGVTTGRGGNSAAPSRKGSSGSGEAAGAVAGPDPVRRECARSGCRLPPVSSMYFDSAQPKTRWRAATSTAR